VIQNNERGGGSPVAPRGQMGNRPGRSTKLAVRLVQDVVRTTRAGGGMTWFLHLNITVAFDTANYIRFVYTLKAKGSPD
jgi:hypothetical protein